MPTACAKTRSVLPELGSAKGRLGELGGTVKVERLHVREAARVGRRGGVSQEAQEDLGPTRQGSGRADGRVFVDTVRRIQELDEGLMCTAKVRADGATQLPASINIGTFDCAHCPTDASRTYRGHEG